MNNYIIETERLGLRNWQASDLEPFAAMNSNPAVMEFFPKTLKKEDTEQLIKRLVSIFEEHGYTYFAAEIKATKQFIGFIGLAYQTYESDFTPCTDIGWRLAPEFWGNGYATEGAKACLEFGFNKIGLKEIVAVAPVLNIKSQRVMQKIGLQEIKTFEHLGIPEGHPTRPCVLYGVRKASYFASI